MNVIDFHPDELLDREIAGTLSIEDRQRLDDHLRRCAQCRLERRLREDFELELGAGDDATHVQTVVSGALRATNRPEGVRRAIAPSGAPWRKRFIFLLAATMMLAAGLAAAESEVASRVWWAAREKVTTLFRAPSLARDAPRAASKPNVESPTAAGPIALDALNANARDAEIPATTSMTMPKARPSPIANRHAPSTDKRRATVAPAGSVAPTTGLNEPQTAPQSRDSAASLFDDASTARRRGNTPEALGLYRDLQDRFPASPEATLSMAVVARMQLDGGEPKSAASGFASYLATRDRALREESMAGLALALGRLGRLGEELDTWRDLVRAYPRSAYASLARSRLGQDRP